MWASFPRRTRSNSINLTETGNVSIAISERGGSKRPLRITELRICCPRRSPALFPASRAAAMTSFTMLVRSKMLRSGKRASNDGKVPHRNSNQVGEHLDWRRAVDSNGYAVPDPSARVCRLRRGWLPFNWRGSHSLFVELGAGQEVAPEIFFGSLNSCARHACLHVYPVIRQSPCSFLSI